MNDDKVMYSNFVELMLLNGTQSSQNTFNYYNFLTADSKMYFRNKDYLTIIQDMIASMFDISGLDLQQKYYLLKGIINNGKMFIQKDDKGIIIAPCNYMSDNDDPYSILPDKFTVDKGNFHFDGQLKDNQTVAYLTPDLLPLSITQRYATMLSDVDTSMVNNIIYCRISPIISAYNDKTKQAYSDVIDNMIRGELKNVILDRLNMQTQQTNPITVSDISKADYATKIQCLSMFHQDLISRLAMLFGVDYKHLDKQANALQSEMENGDDYMEIYPRILISCLRYSLEKLGFKVSFSKSWEWLEQKEPVSNDKEQLEPDSKEKEPLEPDSTDKEQKEPDNNKDGEKNEK